LGRRSWHAPDHSHASTGTDRALLQTLLHAEKHLDHGGGQFVAQETGSLGADHFGDLEAWALCRRPTRSHTPHAPLVFREKSIARTSASLSGGAFGVDAHKERFACYILNGILVRRHEFALVPEYPRKTALAYTCTRTVHVFTTPAA